MRLEKWALVAEIGSAIAVVISLVFVGLQVRLGADETAVNTAAIRSSAFQELQTQIADLQVLVIENADLRSALIQLDSGGQGPESMEQVQIVNAWLRLIFRHGEIAYLRYEEGLIDESALRSAMGPVRGNLGSPYSRENWTSLSPILDPGYVRYVNEQILGPD